MDRVKSLIAQNPRHLYQSALHFESLVRDTDQNAPEWMGYLKVAGQLSIEISKQYPVTIPPITDWPTDAQGEDLPWTSDEVGEWRNTDPNMRWNTMFDFLVKDQYEGSRITTRIAVSQFQAQGKDII